MCVSLPVNGGHYVWYVKLYMDLPGVVVVMSVVVVLELDVIVVSSITNIVKLIN